MKLSELESLKLMPRFAEAYTWACKAFDEWISQTHTRADALSIPWSLEGIAALSDEELINAYEVYSKIPYFSDLPREYRNRILFTQMISLQKGITLEVLRDIFEYISPSPIHLATIDDTLAFDEIGNLVDEDYLHLYNINFYESEGNLSAITIERIISTLKKFMRASAKLNKLDLNSILYGDYDAWGIALWGEDIPSPRVNTVKALRGAAIDLGYGWGLAEAKRCVDAAAAAPSAPYAITPLDDSLGHIQYCFFSNSDAKNFVKRIYVQTSSGVYAAASGSIGIYRVAPTPREFEKMYREE